MTADNLYIACLDLRGRRCVVVGGGPVGHEKIEGLLNCGADVVVVAPEAVDDVQGLADAGLIELRSRAFRTSDLAGAFLVIAATSHTGLNRLVHRDAETRNMLVNVADVPALCNFILPAIHRNGPLAIAISTAGASPALAQRMKREAAANFDDAYAQLASILRRARPWAKDVLPTYQHRKRFFDGIVNGQPDPIALLRAGRTADCEALVERARSAAERALRAAS
ncbi:MAG: precorrin-2 dehydrogenase/sirohydrochlorin ferrochelatase family protein [Actinomycetota bacterium]